ncbi:hypothetical protein [Scopulibacillus darangshiensis]|nr:hypothetical protein [Scopulibacillus darangshiensis]
MRKPVITFEERLEWINHENQFESTLARLQLRQLKLEEMRCSQKYNPQTR